MAASAASKGYFSSIFSYIQQRPIISLCAGCGAFATGYTAGTGEIPFYKRNKQPVLNQSSFTPYTLIAKHHISPSSSIFVLRPPPSQGAVDQLNRVWTGSSCLWSVQAKQPQLQIGREYTPIPPTPVLGGSQVLKDGEVENSDIHLLIRKEKNGEMTTYLDALPLESRINLRGPFQDVQIPKEVDEVLFLAGGTGISPALQVAHIMAKRPGAKVHILWANRRRDECIGAPIEVIPSSPKGVTGFLSSTLGYSKASTIHPSGEEDKGLVVKVIEEMRDRSPPGQFEVQYFVDEDDSFIRSREVKRILASKPGTSDTGTKLIMVAGPEGFVDYWAGRKRLEEGREAQGPLRGRLAQIELNGWKVWKV